VVFKKRQIRIGERTGEQKILMKGCPRDPRLRYPARIREKDQNHEIKNPQITREILPEVLGIVLKSNPTLRCQDRYQRNGAINQQRLHIGPKAMMRARHQPTVLGQNMILN
jgi:hypothetical protein